MAAQNVQPVVRHVTPGAVYALIGAAIAGIWISVILATIYAPDMITGSSHEHMPLVGFTYWIWGLAATGSVMLTAQKGIRARVDALGAWIAMAVGVVGVWIGVMLVAVFGPVFVTGTDPTTLPLAALGIPIVGLFLTWFLCKFIENTFQVDASA
jgi:hypothetical protein